MSTVFSAYGRRDVINMCWMVCQSTRYFWLPIFIDVDACLRLYSLCRNSIFAKPMECFLRRKPTPLSMHDVLAYDEARKGADLMNKRLLVTWLTFVSMVTLVFPSAQGNVATLAASTAPKSSTGFSNLAGETPTAS